MKRANKDKLGKGLKDMVEKNKAVRTEALKDRRNQVNAVADLLNKTGAMKRSISGR